MRLFFLDRIRLADVDTLSPAPRAGDAIVFLRRGQDTTGAITVSLSQKNIRVINGESLLEKPISNEINDLGVSFIDNWPIENGVDVGKGSEVSISELISPIIVKLCLPWYVIRTGEILRRAIKELPSTSQVLTDIRDGEDSSSRTPYLLLLSAVREVARVEGLPLQTLSVQTPLPPVRPNSFLQGLPKWQTFVRSLIGGLRPSYLRDRWLTLQIRLGIKSPPRPDVYIFSGRGMTPLQKRLANNFFHVASSVAAPDVKTRLRYDQTLAFPTWSDIRGAMRILGYLSRKTATSENSMACVYEGINYGPILAVALRRAVRSQLVPHILGLAQVRQFFHLLQPRSIVTNGETDIGQRSALLLTKHVDTKSYYICHALNVHRFAPRCIGRNHTHTTFMACGDDHKEQFGAALSRDQKPRFIATGSPVLEPFRALRSQRKRQHKKRLLILCYGQAGHVIAARVRRVDTYIADVLGVAKKLIADGWTVTYRDHPGMDMSDLNHSIARDLNVDTDIAWNNAGPFEQALLKHDVVITNASTTYYQSLYGEWPTVFYEPLTPSELQSPEPPYQNFFVGVPAAADIERPIVHNPDSLLEIVQQSVQQESLVSTFPHAFATNHHKRFLGPNPIDPLSEIYRVFANDLTNGSQPTPSAVSSKSA